MILISDNGSPLAAIVLPMIVISLILAYVSMLVSVVALVMLKIALVKVNFFLIILILPDQGAGTVSLKVIIES
jgi:hypothetical protein